MKNIGKWFVLTLLSCLISSKKFTVMPKKLFHLFAARVEYFSNERAKII